MKKTPTSPMLTILTPDMLRKLADPIAILGMSVRTANTLDGQGVFTVEDLLLCCPRRKVDCNLIYEDQRVKFVDSSWTNERMGRPVPCRATVHLLDVSNFGEKTLDEVYGCLSAHGFVRNLPDKKSRQRKM